MLFAKKLDPRATLPTCAHPGEDLGYDLYALESVVLVPGVVTKVRTGIAAEHVHAEWVNSHYTHISDGLLIRDRSSMASKSIRTSGGVIDTGYRGEIIVLMTFDRYLTDDELQYAPAYGFGILAGDKIAQMVPVPVLTKEGVMQIEAFTEEITTRGANGFGSTGR